MGILTSSEGGIPLLNGWIRQIEQLNATLHETYSDLGGRAGRRELLERHIGPIRPMQRLAGARLLRVLEDRPLVGVDGSVNTLGGAFPHYIDFLRAMAKPTRGESVVLQQIYSPLTEDVKLTAVSMVSVTMKLGKEDWPSLRSGLHCLPSRKADLLLY